MGGFSLRRTLSQVFLARIGREPFSSAKEHQDKAREGNQSIFERVCSERQPSGPIRSGRDPITMTSPLTVYSNTIPS